MYWSNNQRAGVMLACEDEEVKSKLAHRRQAFRLPLLDLTSSGRRPDRTI